MVTYFTSFIFRMSQKFTSPSLQALANMLWLYFWSQVTLPKFASLSNVIGFLSLTSHSRTVLSYPLDRNVFSDIVQIYYTPVLPWSKALKGPSVSSDSAESEYMRTTPSEQPVKNRSFFASSYTMEEITPRCWPVSLRVGCMTSAEAIWPSFRLE